MPAVGAHLCAPGGGKPPPYGPPSPGQVKHQAQGQPEPVTEAGQALQIGLLALQLAELIQKTQPKSALDPLVAGADALQPLLMAGELPEIQVVGFDLIVQKFSQEVVQFDHLRSAKC